MSECDACGHEGDDVELSLGGHSRCEANLCKFCRDTDAFNELNSLQKPITQ